MSHSAIDSVAVFGFLSGFFTLVALAYRRQLKSRIPLIPIGLTCCGAYAFLAGNWMVGFVLIAVAASEFRRPLRTVSAGSRIPLADATTIRSEQIENESRITRMFGRI